MFQISKLKETCKQIKNLMGTPEILIHNAVKGNFEKLSELICSIN